MPSAIPGKDVKGILGGGDPRRGAALLKILLPTVANPNETAPGSGKGGILHPGWAQSRYRWGWWSAGPHLSAPGLRRAGAALAVLESSFHKTPS